MKTGTAGGPGQAPAVVKGGTERALQVLKELARHPEGVTLEEIARRVGAAKSSVHRALAALVKAGLAVHPRAGHYRLGSEFVCLAYAHQEAQAEPRAVQPCLQELADTIGETAHYAELDGTDVVYLAKVSPGGQSIQMTSTIGGRNPAYCTGVGKALLGAALAAAADPEAFLATLGPLERRTAKTLCDGPALRADLQEAARRGYALDDEESELGVNCIAFPLFRASPTTASGAISIAALRHRLALDKLRGHAPRMREIIERHLGPVLR